MTDKPAKKAEDVEITEMTDIRATRYDGVTTAASGYPILMLKSVKPPAGEEPPAEPAEKADPPEEPAEDDKTSGDEPVKEDDGIVKALQERVTALETAKAEAESGYERRIETLETQLAKVLDTPIPGGPVITAPLAARKARETEQRQVEAARMRRMAEETPDPDLKSFYKKRARELGEED